MPIMQRACQGAVGCAGAGAGAGGAGAGAGSGAAGGHGGPVKFNVIRTFSVFGGYMVSDRREPRGDMEATLHRIDTVIREPESVHP